MQRKTRITGTLYALILHKPIDGWIISLLLLTLDTVDAHSLAALQLKERLHTFLGKMHGKNFDLGKTILKHFFSTTREPILSTREIPFQSN